MLRQAGLLALSRALLAVPCRPRCPLAVPCPRCPLSVPRCCHQQCPPPELAVPKPGWSARMQRCHARELQRAARLGWTRLQGCNRARLYRDKVPWLAGDSDGDSDSDGDTRLFPRAIEGEGLGFEFVTFLSVPKGHLRCLCQLGPFLEGHPGLIHGGAIATIIDTSLGTLALALAGRVVTANLSIDYMVPVPLHSVVLLEVSLQRREGRKLLLSCDMRDSEGDTVYARATGLFIQQDPPKKPGQGGGQ